MQIVGVNECCQYDASFHEHLYFEEYQSGHIIKVIVCSLCLPALC